MRQTRDGKPNWLKQMVLWGTVTWCIGIVGSTSTGLAAMQPEAGDTAATAGVHPMLMSKGRHVTLGLTLDATLHEPTPPVPPISGTTKLTLPLYPTAKVTNQPYNLAFAEIPGSPYVRTGKAEYLIPSSLQDAEEWYETHMKNVSYRLFGQGSTGNTKTGLYSQGLIFHPIHQPAGHQIEVDLSFQSVENGTLLQYWATDVVTPPRPITSLLPNDIVSVELQVSESGQEALHRTETTTNNLDIADLRDAINALTQIQAGVNPGGPAVIGEADLIVHCGDGRIIPVHILEPLGVSVDGVGLYDTKSTVWNAVMTLLGLPTFPDSSKSVAIH